MLTQVAEQYKDKGVVFYAINKSEDIDNVRQFMTASKLGCKVALDKDGKVSEQFKVRGIPHLVIIDKKGVVRVVHSGLPANVLAKIVEELEEILSGKGEKTKEP